MAIDARIYYATERSPGILCEVLHGHVYEVSGDAWGRPIGMYDGGKFVRLVEVPEPVVKEEAGDAKIP